MPLLEVKLQVNWASMTTFANVTGEMMDKLNSISSGFPLKCITFSGGAFDKLVFGERRAFFGLPALYLGFFREQYNVVFV